LFKEKKNEFVSLLVPGGEKGGGGGFPPPPPAKAAVQKKKKSEKKKKKSLIARKKEGGYSSNGLGGRVLSLPKEKEEGTTEVPWKKKATVVHARQKGKGPVK